MKNPSETNHLCLSCRRACKQPASVLIAACPRYYQGPKVKRGDWKQLSLVLDPAEAEANAKLPKKAR